MNLFLYLRGARREILQPLILDSKGSVRPAHD